jgi:hypothetical protein
MARGLWFFLIEWFARLWVYRFSIVMPKDVGSMGVRLRCIVSA